MVCGQLLTVMVKTPMQHRHPHESRWLPIISLILAMMLWASSFVALKLAFRSFDPMVVIFGRMVVASACFLLFYTKIWPVTYQKGDLKYISFMVLCEPCLYFLFEAKALENTTASQAGMITALLPLMVAAAARFFLKEKVSVKCWVGFVIAIVGAIWLSTEGIPSHNAPNPVLGNFLEFVAMVCATGYIITMKRLTSRYSPFFLTAMQAFCGSIFYLPILLLPTTSLPTDYNLNGIIAIVYLGAFVTMGAYGLYNFGVSRIPVSQASAFVNLIPAFTVFLGWLILDETFTPAQYLAAAMIFTGIFVSQDTRIRIPRRSVNRSIPNL